MMIKKIIGWFRKRIEKRKKKKLFKDKMNKLRERDPFFYKH